MSYCSRCPQVRGLISGVRTPRFSRKFQSVEQLVLLLIGGRGDSFGTQPQSHSMLLELVSSDSMSLAEQANRKT